MIKRELLNKLQCLLDKKGMHKIETFSGKINESCNKSTIKKCYKMS